MNRSTRRLRRGGLAPAIVLHAAHLIVDYVNGFALAEGLGRLEHPDERHENIAELRRRSAVEFPAMNRVFQSLAAIELRADFDAGLQIIFAGIRALGDDTFGTEKFSR